MSRCETGYSILRVTDDHQWQVPGGRFEGFVNCKQLPELFICGRVLGTLKALFLVLPSDSYMPAPARAFPLVCDADPSVAKIILFPLVVPLHGRCSCSRIPNWGSPLPEGGIRILNMYFRDLADPSSVDAR